MEVNHTNWSTREQGRWAILTVNGRLDSFNFDSFCQQFEELIKKNKLFIAVDLSQAKFLSLPSIKYLTVMAVDIQKQGGQMALMSASEKLKRQIDIYASLNSLRIVRGVSDLGDQTMSPAKSPEASV